MVLRPAPIITSTPDTVLGFALAGAGTNWGLEQALGTGRSDAFQAGVYGTKYFGPAYIGAALAFTNNWFTTNRTALGDQLTAHFQGQSFGVRVESGYRYAVASAMGVTPYAAIQAQDFHTPTYSETDLTGGGFGLTYNAMTRDRYAQRTRRAVRCAHGLGSDAGAAARAARLGARLGEQSGAERGLPGAARNEFRRQRRARAAQLGADNRRRRTASRAAMDADRQVRRRVRLSRADLRRLRYAALYVVSACDETVSTTSPSDTPVLDFPHRTPISEAILSAAN